MKLTKIILLIAAAVLLAACDTPSREYGKTESEPGIVKHLTFVPSGHGTGTGVGVAASGQAVVTSSSVYIPARYGIVFECQHGTFAVEGHPDLWKRLREGQEVTLKYRTLYNVWPDGTRAAVDLDFLTAEAR